jgi:hypothetical protein
MRRIAVLVATTLVAWLTVTVGTATAAYPVTLFGPYTEVGGSTEGAITWYNRSAGIQGYVADNATRAGEIQVKFDFYSHDTYVDTQTRTVTNGTKSFNFTVAGPPGGITIVEISLCDDSGCDLEDLINRP